MFPSPSYYQACRARMGLNQRQIRKVSRRAHAAGARCAFA